MLIVPFCYQWVLEMESSSWSQPVSPCFSCGKVVDVCNMFPFFRAFFSSLNTDFTSRRLDLIFLLNNNPAGDRSDPVLEVYYSTIHSKAAKIILWYSIFISYCWYELKKNGMFVRRYPF